MKNSYFIISLDFELMWGVRDKRSIENYGANILGVRQVIPSLLHLFEKYDVQATFATVGFLFAKNKKELLHFLPNILPQYTQTILSPFEYLKTIGDDEACDPYHYAPSLIELIKNEGRHEIATHTFSHYYCQEGASLASFESDLLAAKNIASANEIKLNSIVFPRNQYTQEHTRICETQGLIAYRGNEKGWLYKPAANAQQKQIVARAGRLLDAYTNLSGHHTYSINPSATILDLPASRFLRPYNASTNVIDFLKLQRIKNSMSYAAKNNEAYHLWWHPHNFGSNTIKNLHMLEALLQHFSTLRKENGMLSLTMERIAKKAVHDSL